MVLKRIWPQQYAITGIKRQLCRDTIAGFVGWKAEVGEIVSFAMRYSTQLRTKIGLGQGDALCPRKLLFGDTTGEQHPAEAEHQGWR